jgi:hypothetical protein
MLGDVREGLWRGGRGEPTKDDGVGWEDGEVGVELLFRY